MATFAMMNGNTVSNVIMADDKEATEAALGCTLVEYTAENPAGIGWVLDETGKFNPPAVTEEDAKASAEAKLAALGLTADEIAALTK